MKIERPCVVWIILCIILFCFSEGFELERISEKETISGRIGEGRSYFLSARESQLLTVQFETTSTKNVAQLIVLTSDLDFVGLIQTPTDSRKRGSCDHDEPKVTQALCSSGSDRGYYMNVTGTNGARYSFNINLEDDNRLEEDKLEKGFVKERNLNSDDVQYFYFDVDEDNDVRPLEVRLKSDSSVKALLSASYEDCPLESFDDRYQQNTTAYLTFTRQATITVSRYSNPKMRKGRWIFRVEALHKCRGKKRFTIDPSYGQKYEDYILPVFILLFVLPVCSLIILAFFFILFYLLSKGIESQGEALDPIHRRQEAWWFTLVTFLLLFIIGIQFTVRELRYMDRSGDYDRCFYNERCKRPLGFQAFNNMWSNFAYVIVGLELIVYFYLAKLLFKSAVPRDFSVMFAIAIAIVAQGVLSTTYHVCPTRTNFQMDTDFMFVIGALVMYELYRKSFKKVFNAGYIFVVLVILILLNYFGTLLDTADNDDAYMVNEGSKGYRLIIYFCFFLPVFLIAIRCIYFHEKSFKEIFTDFGVPGHWGRILLLLCLWIAVTVIWFAVDDNTDMFLYSIVAATVICLVLYFLNNLFRHRKTSGILLLGLGWFVLLALGLSFWAAALALFGLPWANKSASPAASRNENRGCIIMDFYDTHDLWHILGAMALGLIAVLIAHFDPDENNSAEKQKLDFQKGDKYSQAGETRV